MSNADNNAFDLWLSYTHAGSFLEEMGSLEPKYLVSIEGICDDALARIMEIKTRILNAKEELKQNTP